MTRRRLAVLLATLAVFAAGSGALPPATAEAQGDTAAVAVNTKDGSSIFRLAFSVRRVMSEVIDQQNAAVAYASCEACQTVAISIQVLLVASDPEIVTPTNLAIAINDNCTLCFTLASAYQFVLGGDGRVQLTGEGRHQLQRIRQELWRLRHEELPIAEIQMRTDALMDELRQVLDTQLVIRGPTREEQEEVAEGEGEEQAGEGDEPRPTETTPEKDTPTQTTPEPTQTTPAPTQTAPAEAPSDSDSDRSS